MALTRSESGTEVIYRLHGSARIGDADELKQAFLDALQSPFPLITLDAIEVDEVDLTFFQLALALQKALSDQGRHLIFRTLPADHPVATTAKLLGLPLGHHFTQVEASR